MDGLATFILAGGTGSRLYPLTRDRAKPAVRFGTRHRIVDFTLANCLHSGVRSVAVLTQYRAESLSRYIAQEWHRAAGATVRVCAPATQRGGGSYRGTADAVFRNLSAAERDDTRDVLVLAGDHIYAMDYRPFVAVHRQQEADVTIATIRVPRTDWSHFGMLRHDACGRVREFIEKPDPGDPRLDGGEGVRASMGIYVFRYAVLCRLLAEGPGAGCRFDFGAGVIPDALHRHDIYSYAFSHAPTGVPAYWRDAGTIDSCFAAHMELLDGGFSVDPEDPIWPAAPAGPSLDSPFGGFEAFEDTDGVRMGPACMLEGCVRHTVLGRGVVIESGAHVQDAIILDGARVGAGCRVRHAIIGERVFVAPGTVLGFGEDPEGTYHSPSGVAVVVVEGGKTRRIGGRAGFALSRQS